MSIHIAGRRLLGSVQFNEVRGSAMLVAHTEPHLIVLRADKFTAYLNEEGLSEIIAWRQTHNESDRPVRERYSKFAKSLLSAPHPDEYATHAVGDPLEIAPERGIDGVHLARRLSVNVLLRGRGAEGLSIEASWAAAGNSGTVKVGRTDSAGHMTSP